MRKPTTSVRESVTKPEVKKTTADIERALKAKEAARNRYREKAGVVLSSCERNLSGLEDYASVKEVRTADNVIRQIPCIAVTGIGPLLDVTGVSILRWVERGMLPAPIFHAAKGQVYHAEEVRSFMQIIGDLQLETRQYRQAHTEVKERIFRENARIRRGLFTAAA